jgi:hypothetical protein
VYVMGTESILVAYFINPSCTVTNFQSFTDMETPPVLFCTETSVCGFEESRYVLQFTHSQW